MYKKLILKIKTMNKKLLIAAIAIMTIGALAITAFGAIGKGANDPLQLIEYTPEEKAQLLQNSSEWKRLQIEIENAQMIQRQLNEDSKRIQQGVDNRLSTLLPVAQAAEIHVENTAKNSTDLDKLAYAIAMAETKDCQLGYGAMYSNCFGIKRGSIVPCETGKNNMCIFANKDESYRAFKKIWAEGYGGGFPTYAMAATWTGNDHPDSWLKNVSFHYNK